MSGATQGEEGSVMVSASERHTRVRKTKQVRAREPQIDATYDGWKTCLLGRDELKPDRNRQRSGVGVRRANNEL